jgi:hypothetical protein
MANEPSTILPLPFSIHNKKRLPHPVEQPF